MAWTRDQAELIPPKPLGRIAKCVPGALVAAIGIVISADETPHSLTIRIPRSSSISFGGRIVETMQMILTNNKSGSIEAALSMCVMLKVKRAGEVDSPSWLVGKSEQFRGRLWAASLSRMACITVPVRPTIAMKRLNP